MKIISVVAAYHIGIYHFGEIHIRGNDIVSYCVEFDHIFIHSAFGFTPLCLMGDSSVWEKSGTRRRMAREWMVFHSLLGVSEEKILEDIKPMLDSGYQEHWKRNGKWVDNKGLINWVKNSCKNAASLESILKANFRTCVTCCLRGPNWQTYLEVDVRNTTELDAWIVQAKAAMASDKNLYPKIIMNYEGNPITHPNKQRDSDAMVVIKRRGRYLTKYDSSSSCWSAKREQALVFTVKEANNLPANLQGRQVSASVLSAPENFIVKIVSAEQEKGYLYKLTGRRQILYMAQAKNAKHYSTKAAAQRAAEAAQKRAPGWQFVVITDDGDIAERKI